MDPYMQIIIAAIFGIIGGLAHQVHDSEEPNNKNALIRGFVLGLFSSVLVVSMHPVNDLWYIINQSLIAGYMSDSIVLNVVRRSRNKCQQNLNNNRI